MMFVRPAQNWAEQNLIVYQFGMDLYFATIKPIEAKQELKVGSFDKPQGFDFIYCNSKSVHCQLVDQGESTLQSTL